MQLKIMLISTLLLILLSQIISDIENVFAQGIESSGVTINETGSISGFVKPAIEGLSIFSITQGFQVSDVSKRDGSYEITNLRPGTYSLYIPANATKDFHSFRWSFIEVGANKHLTEYNITLTPLNSSYLLDQIIVRFYPNVTFKEKMNIINSYGSIIMDYNYVVTSIEDATVYGLNIPDDKTVLEMVELFKSNPEVKDAFPNEILHIAPVTPVEENATERKESITTNLTEKYKESELPTIEPELEEIKPKVKDILWDVVIIPAFVLIVVFLFIKFRRR